MNGLTPAPTARHSAGPPGAASFAPSSISPAAASMTSFVFESTFASTAIRFQPFSSVGLKSTTPVPGAHLLSDDPEGVQEAGEPAGALQPIPPRPSSEGLEQV